VHDGWPRNLHPYDVYVQNLERLRLVEVHYPDNALRELSRQGRRPKQIIGPSWPTVTVTAFGQAFVAACTPPGEVVAQRDMS
jgi:hypothetical protein